MKIEDVAKAVAERAVSAMEKHFHLRLDAALHGHFVAHASEPKALSQILKGMKAAEAVPGGPEVSEA